MNFCFHFVQNGLPELLDGIGRGVIFCSAKRLKSVNELRRNVAFTVEPLVKAKMNVQLVIDLIETDGVGDLSYKACVQHAADAVNLLIILIGCHTFLSKMYSCSQTLPRQMRKRVSSALSAAESPCSRFWKTGRVQDLPRLPETDAWDGYFHQAKSKGVRSLPDRSVCHRTR